MTEELPAPASFLRRREAREGPYLLELPISKQFTPAQIESLREFLRLIRDHGPEGSGTFTGARAKVKDRFFSATRRGGTEEKKLTAAGNAIGSARHWGLLNEDYTLTEVGHAAADAADEEEAARLLVENFLRHLGGAYTTKAILDLIRANDGLAPEKTKLAVALHDRLIYENRDGTDHSAVLGWLSHPGVRIATQQSRGRWFLDERRFAELAGTTAEQVDAIARRDPVQLAILTELARSESGQSDSAAMQRILAARLDLEVSAPEFRRLYLDPMHRDGLIEIGGRARRGATAFSIKDSARADAIVDLVARFDADGTLQYTPADLLRPTSEIVANLDRDAQPDRNRRGAALEHLALRLLSWIGLTGLR